MIEISSLTKVYNKLYALKEVNIRFADSGVYALVGPNACGKTTLIKSILGLVIPNQGEIVVHGTNVKNDSQYKRLIGYMPQIGKYPANLTIGQLIDLVIKLRDQPVPLDQELFEAFKLQEMQDKKMNTLSGGTIQKVSAALSFMFDPPILILDEPTAGLDPISSEILKEKIVKERDKGKLILITTHLLTELNDIADQIAFMNEGKVKFIKTKAQIMDEAGHKTLSKALVEILKEYSAS